RTVTVSISGTSGGDFLSLHDALPVSVDVSEDADATVVTLSASAGSVGEGGSVTYTASVNNAVTGTDLEITLSNGQTITIPVGSSTAGVTAEVQALTAVARRLLPATES